MTAPGTPGLTSPGDAVALEVAAVVGAHRSVVRLDDGPYGTIATYLPGRRLVGVRVGLPGEPVVLGVVLRLGRPLPEVAGELRGQVAALCGGQPVDVVVAGVE
ncbi:MAG TPA: hypothetical protein VGH99_03600 [Pseudonocardia sp.]